MKCPVCDKIVEDSIQKCRFCGFSDLRTEFINDDELEMWKKYIVYPCRFAYQTSVAQKIELERKFQKELTLLKNGQKGIEEFSGNEKTESPIFKKLELDKNSDWITKGNITYKNFYECKVSSYSTCEASNFVLDLNGNRMIANFFVKKTFDFRGADSTYFIAFKWKLKDDYGIVVADGYWSNDKMQVGDITKGSISISGLDPTIKYVLELVNN